MAYADELNLFAVEWKEVELLKSKITGPRSEKEIQRRTSVIVEIVPS